MKHIHAELIKAWADGAEIEARYLKASGWTEWRLEDGGFIWYVGGAEYRIKPEPKEDIEETVLASYGVDGLVIFNRAIPRNLKITFDGETGELKSAEVIK
jgi:hypothetical protein